MSASLGIVLVEMEYEYELINNGMLSHSWYCLRSTPEIKLKVFPLNHIFTNFIIK